MSAKLALCVVVPEVPETLIMYVPDGVFVLEVRFEVPFELEPLQPIVSPT